MKGDILKVEIKKSWNSSKTWPSVLATGKPSENYLFDGEIVVRVKDGVLFRVSSLEFVLCYGSFFTLNTIARIL